MTAAADDPAGDVPHPPAQPRSPHPPDNLPFIRASELAEYSFCRRAWWLSTVKRMPSHNQAALNRGVQLHHRHAVNVRAAGYWRQTGFFLFGGGGLLLIIGVFYYFLL